MSLIGYGDATVEREAVPTPSPVVVVAAMATTTRRRRGSRPRTLRRRGAATDSADRRAGFSNTGPHVASPGVGILSTYWDDTYASLNGTSMATPHVAASLRSCCAQNSLPWPRSPTSCAPRPSRCATTPPTPYPTTSTAAPGAADARSHRGSAPAVRADHLSDDEPVICQPSLSARVGQDHLHLPGSSCAAARHLPAVGGQRRVSPSRSSASRRRRFCHEPPAVPRSRASRWPVRPVARGGRRGRLVRVRPVRLRTRTATDA